MRDGSRGRPLFYTVTLTSSDMGILLALLDAAECAARDMGVAEPQADIARIIDDLKGQIQNDANSN